MKSGVKPGKSNSNANKNKKIIIVLIALFIIIAFFLIWTYTSSDEIKILNIYHLPENPKPGENITIIAEITGGSSLFGISPECGYNYFFNEGASGQGSMISIGDNLYSFTHQASYNESTNNWYTIRVDRSITEMYSIQIGNEKSNISTLTISNVTHYPKIPSTDTYSVQVSADIQSNVSITEVCLKYRVIFPKSPVGVSGESCESNGEPYIDSIPLFWEGYPYGSNSYYPKGSKVYYAIGAKDRLGNKAVSAIYSFTIS